MAEETVNAVRYKIELAVDPIHDITTRAYRVFVGNPYNFIACYHQRPQLYTRERFVVFHATECEKTQSPSFGRQREPILEYENIVVPKTWAVKCRAISQMQEDVNNLIGNTRETTPEGVFPSLE